MPEHGQKRKGTDSCFCFHLRMIQVTHYFRRSWRGSDIFLFFKTSTCRLTGEQSSVTLLLSELHYFCSVCPASLRWTNVILKKVDMMFTERYSSFLFNMEKHAKHSLLQFDAERRRVLRLCFACFPFCNRVIKHHLLLQVKFIQWIEYHVIFWPDA